MNERTLTRIGGGMLIAPAAEPDDGALDCIVIPSLSRSELIRRLPTIYTGSHLRVDGVEHFRGRTIEAEPIEGDIPFEVDGEALGRLPFRVEVAPRALTIVGAQA